MEDIPLPPPRTQTQQHIDRLINQGVGLLKKEATSIGQAGFSWGILAAVTGIIIYEATYLIRIAGSYVSDLVPSDEKFVDSFEAFYSFPIYLLICYGLLKRRNWAWCLAMVWLGIPLLPIPIPKPEYTVLTAFFNYRLAAICFFFYLLIGEPMRVLAFLYLVSNRQKFTK